MHGTEVPHYQITAKEVKKRLKHLRNTFGRIKKKQEKSGSGVIRMTPRKAHIVTRLEFLRSHTVTRPTTSTFTANKTGLVGFTSLNKINIPTGATSTVSWILFKVT